MLMTIRGGIFSLLTTSLDLDEDTQPEGRHYYNVESAEMNEFNCF